MTGLRTLVLGFAAIALGSSWPLLQEGPRATVAIVFHDLPEDDQFGTVAVHGLPERQLSKLGTTKLERIDWLELFSIRTSNSKLQRIDQPAILGSYNVEREGIRFQPRFPFVAGMSYHSQFDGQAFDRLAGGGSVKTPSAVLDFTMPEPARRASTGVDAVYPTATELPENLLRLYVYFSASMRAKGIENYVHLYDGSGEEVDLPFVEIRNGLWDPSQQRLTLFFHPGRIKRGVAPNLEMGPALRHGESFRLVIEPGLKDAMGYPLVDGFEREFKVVSADRESPNQADWVVSAPSTANAPLRLRFPEPLDYALLQRMITVERVGGRRMAGNVEISQNETRWEFFSDTPWTPGKYVIHIDPRLEDVAGNTFSHLFDEEISGPRPEPAEALPELELRFQVVR